MKTNMTAPITGLTMGLAMSLTLVTAATAFGEDMHQHGVMISDAWSRETTPGARVGGGYLTITNHGMKDDRLVAVAAAHAGKVEVHTMTMKDDVVVMRPVENGLTIPAGDAVKLAPGGEHLMFMKLSHPHVADEPFEATLSFEHAGEKVVVFDVLSMRESMARMVDTDDHHHSTDHSKEHHNQ